MTARSSVLAVMKLHEAQEQRKQHLCNASRLNTGSGVVPPCKGQHRAKLSEDSALPTPRSDAGGQAGKCEMSDLVQEVALYNFANANSKAEEYSQTDFGAQAPILRTLSKPEKYSQAYFEARIKSLRTEIKKKIPTQDDLVPTENSVYLPILRSLEAAKQTLESSKAVAKALQKEQKSHPEDEGWKDSSLVDPVKRGMEEAQAAIDRLEQAATNSGCAIVKSSGLLDEKGPDRRVRNCSRNTFRGRATKCTILKKGSLLQIKSDLMVCTVLVQATPKKLAEWCAEDPDANRLILDRFLGPSEEASGLLMKFLEAGGPSNGNYGMAFSIYNKLQQELQIVEKLGSSVSNKTFFLRRRLAVAVALELATPIPIFKQEDTFVDPVERFRYYANFASSSRDGLDPAYFTLSVWELRKAVNANATHDDLTWGRQFLKNYRPDQVYMKDQKWKYVMSVRTDVGYRHPDHEFTNYQDLLSAGGECGPRAFFGRFISKAWGLPTWGVRQPGHAAMTRWTSDKSLGGWTVCLGAGWEYSWWDDDRYGGKSRRGPDFYEETKARTAAGCPHTYFKTVVLLECLAESLGETVEEDFVPTKFWRFLALAQRKMLARSFGSTETDKNDGNDNRNVQISASGWPICKEFGCICHRYPGYDSEPNSTRRKRINPDVTSAIHTKTLSQNTRKLLEPRESIPNESFLEPKKPSKRVLGRIIHKQQEPNQVSIQPDGTIVIPAATFVEPKKPTKKVLVMKSFLGGDQLHLVHDGEVEYDVPSSITTGGTYSLSAKVVNVHRDQKPLLINIEKSLGSEDDNFDYDDVKDNDSDSDSFLHVEENDIDDYEMIHLPQQGQQELEVQYTKGYWEQTKSIQVYLSPGGKLKLSRKDPCKGLSIKEIYLKQV
jgi:hypothetical protein